MNKKSNLIKEIKNNLKIKKKISETTPLDSIDEFDSIGRLTFIAMADKKFKIDITGDQLTKCNNVNDLIVLLSKSKRKI